MPTMQTLSTRMRIGCPLTISSSAFRCLLHFLCPARWRISWLPTTECVVSLVTPSVTVQPAPLASSAATCLSSDRLSVKTTQPHQIIDLQDFPSAHDVAGFFACCYRAMRQCSCHYRELFVAVSIQLFAHLLVHRGV